MTENNSSTETETNKDINEDKLVDAAMQSEVFRKKFDEETEKKAIEKADRLLLEKELKSYTDEYLQKSLESYIAISPSDEYELIKKRRDEVLNNSKKLSSEELRSVKNEFDVLYKTEEKLKAQNSVFEEKRKISKNSVPTIDESGAVNTIRHNTDYKLGQVNRLRDIYYKSGIEPTLAWTKELNDINELDPALESRIKSKII